MRRLLITGSSHVAALRLAWEEKDLRPDGLEVDFLAANAKEFRLFTVDGAGIFGLHDETQVPADQLELARNYSGTLLRDIASFDYVLMAGCNLNAAGVLQLVSECRIDQIRNVPADGPRLSQGAWRAFSLALALKQYPSALVAGMAHRTRLALMASPRLSEAALTDPASLPLLREIGAGPEGVAEALRLTDAELKRHAAGEGVAYFPPPEAALAPTGFTREEHTRTSANIRKGKPSDHIHMDAAYGALCLRQVLDWLEAEPEPAAKSAGLVR